MSELKKCPFCGGLPMRCSARRHGFDPAVECTNPDCEVFSIGGDEKWNRRPLEEALEARVRELEVELAEAKEILADSGPYQGMLRRILDAALISRNELIEQCSRLESELGTKGGMLVRMIDRLAEAQATAVRWVTYDGTPETLPPEFMHVVLLANNKIMPATVCFEEITDGGRKAFWSVPFELGDYLEAKPGDRWALSAGSPGGGITMYLTESETKEKACCKGMLHKDGRLMTAACLGSECMAWRWETRGHTLKHVLVDGVMTERFLVDIRTTRGYCGLAGEPHNYDLLESELVPQEAQK